MRMSIKEIFLDRRIKKYVDKTLKTHYLIGKGDYKLERISIGLNTRTYILTIRDKRMVVRFYPFTKRLSAKRFLEASRIIDENRAPFIPGVIYFDLTIKTLLRYGLYVIAIEKIDGVSYSNFKGDSEVISNIGKALASLHVIRDSRMGEIWKSHRKDYYIYLMKKMRESLTEVDRYLTKLGEKKNHIFEWFKRWCMRLENSKEFSLSHHDFNMDNIIIDSAKNVYFLDLDECVFETFGFDLAWALFNFCSKEEERAILKKVYFDVLPERYKRHWDSCQIFYYAWYCLRKAATRSHKAYKEMSRDRDRYTKFKEEALGLWKALSNYMEK